jgi:hypothetical protein
MIIIMIIMIRARNNNEALVVCMICLTHLRAFCGYSLNTTFGRYTGMSISSRFVGRRLSHQSRMFSQAGMIPVPVQMPKLGELFIAPFEAAYLLLPNFPWMMPNVPWRMPNVPWMMQNVPWMMPNVPWMMPNVPWMMLNVPW